MGNKYSRDSYIDEKANDINFFKIVNGKTDSMECAKIDECLVGVSHIRGLRPMQEDMHCIFHDLEKNRIILGIFDGHGGSACASYVSTVLSKRISVIPNLTVDNIINEFINTDEQYYQEISQLKIQERKKYTEMGSTAAIIILEKNIINEKYVAYIAHIGDSRVMISRNGKILHYTSDHKPDKEKEANRIRDAGFDIKNNRIYKINSSEIISINLSRAFGDYNFKDRKKKWAISCVPDVQGPIILEDNDIIIINCDGVNENDLNNEKVCDFVNTHEKMKEFDDITQKSFERQLKLSHIAGDLCSVALSHGSYDNISCLIAKICYEDEKFFSSFSNTIPFDDKY